MTMSDPTSEAMPVLFFSGTEDLDPRDQEWHIVE
jgi:hypothetical protein